jgi:Pyruvate/2-oxoacid:ferredoxin oxidoreductase delta subunit
MIFVDAKLCIGCPACSRACPNGLIVLQDEGASRTIRFSRCEEDCDICVKICSEKALPFTKASWETEIVVPLQPCPPCGKFFAAKPMLEKVLSCVPVELQKDSEGWSWVVACPSCRRKVDGVRAFREVLSRRS